MTDIIDLDEKEVSELVAVCRNESRKINFSDCNNCRLKFLCWTHRKIDDENNKNI